MPQRSDLWTPGFCIAFELETATVRSLHNIGLFPKAGAVSSSFAPWDAVWLRVRLGQNKSRCGAGRARAGRSAEPGGQVIGSQAVGRVRVGRFKRRNDEAALNVQLLEFDSVQHVRQLRKMRHPKNVSHKVNPLAC